MIRSALVPVFAVLAAGSTLAGSPTAPVAVAAPGDSLRIDTPTEGARVRRDVRVSGDLPTSKEEPLTVLFLVDVSTSTNWVQQFDCNGNGAVGDEDDRNRDGTVGDVLDCEIAAVMALNADLRKYQSTADVKVGVVPFADTAVAANMYRPPFGEEVSVGPAQPPTPPEHEEARRHPGGRASCDDQRHEGRHPAGGAAPPLRWGAGPDGPDGYGDSATATGEPPLAVGEVRDAR